MHRLHLMNALSRDAAVRVATLATPPAPVPGLPGRRFHFRRYIAATEATALSALQARYGEDLPQALIQGDPEIDMEKVGRRIHSLSTVWLNPEGNVLHLTPALIEVIFDKDGQEKLRRSPEDVPANVAEEKPVRWSGRKIPKAEAVRRYAFKRSMQLFHIDSLTHDFLYSMAKELQESQSMVLLGSGPDGRGPLVFATNGLPFRGFLEGRVDGPRYILLLHLSNLELKRPV